MTQLELDPDPTPTTSQWEQYLTAAQALDALGRSAADASAAATGTLSSARAELARVRARLEPQRHRLVSEAVRAGVAAPPLDPSPPEQEGARARVAGDPTSALMALRHSQALIESVDAQLSELVPDAHGWWRPPGWLVASIAAGFAAVLLLCALALLLGLVSR